MKPPLILAAILAVLANGAFAQNYYAPVVSPPVRVLDVGNPYLEGVIAARIANEPLNQAIQNGFNQKFQMQMLLQQQQHDLDMQRQQQQWADEAQRRQLKSEEQQQHRQTQAEIVAHQKALQTQQASELAANQQLDRVAEKSKARIAAARQAIEHPPVDETNIFNQASQRRFLETSLFISCVWPLMADTNSTSTNSVNR